VSRYRTTFRKGGGEILVAESDALLSRAALCRLDEAGCAKILDHWESHTVDWDSALAEMKSRWKSQGRRTPSQAILLSPEAQTAILHLPVDPRRPLAFHDMQELVKWELEPYLPQNNEHRIGAILAGRGYLDRADLRRLLDERPPAHQAADPAPLRLGERAVRAGLVTEAQRDECLALQHSAPEVRGELVCGWTPLDGGETDGMWRWLACGVGGEHRRRVVEAFRRHGLRLRAIYPLVGCAAAALNGHLGHADAVFEYNAGFLSYARFDEKKIVAHLSLFTHEVGNPLHSCAETFENDAKQVWLAGRWPNLSAAAEELQVRLDRPCRAVSVPPDAVPATLPEASAVCGVRGAARHFLDRSARAAAVCVRARDPRKPLWSNRRVRSVCLSALLTAALVALTFHFQMRQRAAEEQLRSQRAISARREQLRTLRRQWSDVNASVEFLRTTLPNRQQLISDLLGALESACPEEITIHRLAETPAGEVLLSGWGLSAQGVQAFKIELQSRLPDFVVSDGAQPIRSKRGWRSLDGYAFELRLLPQLRKGRS
jgi:hypothetical protein